MSNERWLDLCEVFEAVRNVLPEQREALLGELAGDNPSLRRDVESLLSWHERAAGFLEPPPEAGERLRIGSDRLLRVLGVGGMGVVYLAERDDGEYDRRVAIKLLPASTLGGGAALAHVLSGELVERFRIERQILATLDHPGIAKLLDGGTTPDGLPYLVMEYVDGERIDQYCSRTKPSLRDRLLLFQKVCAAVQFAHQHLVVHRDLKPSNILVDASGDARLLDFGIAKLLSAGDAEAPTQGAQIGGRLMTPEYASPEQVTGGAITTASDVYALGALLYELLTGQRAQPVGSRTAEEIHRAVCVEVPSNPSAAAEARAASREAHRFARLLKGDLDNIVLRALNKDPQRRYGSAAELAEDLDRFLAGLPVRARGHGALYRAGKFLRRHRVASFAAIIVLGLLTSLVWNLARERRRALEERDGAQALSELLVELYSLSAGNASEPQSRVAGQLLSRVGARAETQLADQPRTRAAVLDTLGRVHGMLGNYDDAERLLATAVALRLGPDPSAANRSLAHLGKVLRQKGDFARAEELLGDALKDGPRAGPEIWRLFTQLELGTVLRRQYRWPEATARYEEAVALARSLPDHNEPTNLLEDRRETLALAQHELALLWFDRGRFRAAETTLREALALYEAVPYRPETTRASMLHSLGRFALQLGRSEEAAGLLERALSLKLELYGWNDSEVFFTLWQLARAQAARGELAKARDTAEKALEVGREALGEANPSYLLALSDQAGILAASGSCSTAELMAHSALERLRNRVGTRHRNLGPMLGRLSSIRLALGDLASAEDLAREGIASQERIFGADHPEVVALARWRETAPRSPALCLAPTPRPHSRKEKT